MSLVGKILKTKFWEPEEAFGTFLGFAWRADW